MSEQEQAQTRQNIQARIIAKAWKDEAYKQELLTNPKTVIEQEFEVEFPDDVKVQVVEENPTSLYFVLPMSPVAIAQEFSEEQLEAIAGGLPLTGKVSAVVTAVVKSIEVTKKVTPRASLVSAAASVGASIGAATKR